MSNLVPCKYSKCPRKFVPRYTGNDFCSDRCRIKFNAETFLTLNPLPPPVPKAEPDPEPYLEPEPPTISDVLSIALESGQIDIVDAIEIETTVKEDPQQAVQILKKAVERTRRPPPPPPKLTPKPTPRQKELANAIGIGISWVGRVSDITAEEPFKAFDHYASDTIRKIGLSDADHKTVVTAVKTLIKVIRDNTGSPEQLDNTIFKNAFK